MVNVQTGFEGFSTPEHWAEVSGEGVFDNSTPKTPQIPQDQQENSPDVETPAGAVIVETSAQGKPTVAEKNGVRYYQPDSTMYKMGYRTDTEYREAQRVGVSYGPHMGDLVPEGTMLVNEGDHKVRVTQDDIEGKSQFGQTAEHIVTKINKGEYKVPVVAISEKGERTQLLLTPDKAATLSGLSGERLFNALQGLGVISGEKQFSEKAGNDFAIITESRKEEQPIENKSLRQFITDDGKLDLKSAVDAGWVDVKDYVGWSITQSDIDRIVAQERSATISQINLKSFIQPDGKLSLTDAVAAGYTKTSDYSGWNVTQSDINSALENIRQKKEDETLLSPFKDGDGYHLQDAVIAGRDDKALNSAIERNFNETDIKEARGIDLFSDYEFTRRVAELKLERPQLSGWEADQMVRAEFRREGKDVVEAPRDSASMGEMLKLVSVDTIGRVTPYTTNVYLWTHKQETNKEFAIGMAVDTGVLVLTVLGIKGIGSISRMASGASKAEKLATNAGRAGAELREATALYDDALMGKVYSKIPTNKASLANAVENARIKSVNADRAFIKHLSKLKEVSPKDLTKLETKSGLRGLKVAIQDVSKATERVKTAWGKVEKTKLTIRDQLTQSEISQNQAHIKALGELQEAQANLESSLNQAGSVMKPRYSPSPPPDEFKGFRAEWEKSGPVLESKDASIRKIQEQLNNWANSRERVELKPKLVKTRLALMEREPIPALKLRPEFSPVEAAKLERPNIPRVAASSKVITTMKPSERGATGGKTETTRKQLAEKDIRDITDARGIPLEDALKKTRTFESVTVKEWTQAKEALQDAIKIADNAKTNEATTQQTINSVKDALQDKYGDMTDSQISVITAAAIKAEAATKTATKTKTGTKLITKPPLAKIPVTLNVKQRIPIPKSSEPNEIKKREFLGNVQGLIARRRGELNGKSVWLVDYYPYGDNNKMVLMGEPPKGAQPARGKGSLQESATLLFGVPPNKALYRDTGAVDDILTAYGNRILVKSVKDSKYKGNIRKL